MVDNSALNTKTVVTIYAKLFEMLKIVIGDNWTFKLINSELDDQKHIELIDQSVLINLNIVKLLELFWLF